MSEWTPVSCEVADVIRNSGLVQPYSGRTDMDGAFGEPCIYTEWGLRSGDVSILREWRYPGPDGEPDPRPCEHEAAARLSAEVQR